MFKKLALNYFDAFEKRNIDKLHELFDLDISLRDWNIEAVGIEEVINVNLEIFKKFEIITVRVISLYAENTTVIGELIITLDNEDTIKVVDIIEFTSFGKIQSIRAYKG